jgi:hypothetical protein
VLELPVVPVPEVAVLPVVSVDVPVDVALEPEVAPIPDVELVTSELELVASVPEPVVTEAAW